jgi:hypothetical protein
MGSYVEADGGFIVDRVPPDSPQARALAAVASLRVDIDRAMAALDAWDRIPPDQADSALLRAALLERAIIALGRVLTASNVRPALQQFVSPPPEGEDEIEVLIHLRNRTVAHSESANTDASAPFVRLRKEALDGSVVGISISAVTTSVEIPHSYRNRLRGLAEWAKSAASAAAPVAQAELFEVVKDMDLEAMWQKGHQTVRLSAHPLEDWEPGARRGKYPEPSEFLADGAVFVDDPKPPAEA